MTEAALHPEDALSDAGASDAYYQIVGAGYAASDPATGTPATATIDLSTEDETGCLLTHDYSTGKTTLKWDTENPFAPAMHGTDADVQVAVEDITHGQMDHRALFDAFQAHMTSGSTGSEGGAAR
jgi:hypothetical protein